MKYIKIRIFVQTLLLLLVLSIPVMGLSYDHKNDTQGSKISLESVLDTLDGENAFKTIEELTSEKYFGRFVGTNGNLLASNYVRDQFSDIGLIPMDGDDDFFIPYEQMVYLVNEEPSLKIEDYSNREVESFKFIKDFIVSTDYNDTKINGSAKGEIYLANCYHDIFGENIDLKDKVVLMSSELYFYEGGKDILNTDNKPRAIVVSYEKEGDKSSFRKPSRMNQRRTTSATEPHCMVFLCNSSTRSKLIDAGKKGYDASLQSNYTIENQTINNVIGVIPGKDESLKDEYIILSAHFDHIGDNYDGNYNPGASDNASGTACIIEIARCLKNTNVQLDRPIMFIAFNSEENGMLGSLDFFGSEKVSPEKVQMLNIDMVANTTDSPITIECYQNNQVYETLKKIAEDMNIDFDFAQGSRAGDHYALDVYGGSAATLVELGLKGYHTPKDTVEIIDKTDLPIILEMAVRFIYSTESYD